MWLSRWWQCSGHRARGLRRQPPTASSVVDKWRDLTCWQATESSRWLETSCQVTGEEDEGSGAGLLAYCGAGQVGVHGGKGESNGCEKLTYHGLREYKQCWKREGCVGLTRMIWDAAESAQILLQPFCAAKTRPRVTAMIHIWQIICHLWVVEPALSTITYQMKRPPQQDSSQQWDEARVSVQGYKDGKKRPEDEKGAIRDKLEPQGRS